MFIATADDPLNSGFFVYETKAAEDRITCMVKTLVINLFAGPGSGKSTFCALIFAKLKVLGIDCEMSLEYAKDIVWEESLKKLDHQIYIFGKQLHRLQRLDGKLKVVITDAPLLHSAIYCSEDHHTFKKLILEEHNKFTNLNYYIKRRKDYNPNGRTQTFEQAKIVDKKIISYLKDNKVKYKNVEGNIDVVDSILKDVSSALQHIDKSTKSKK